MNKIICGDAIEEMKKMEANSIDTIITDPPYGIGFMGKEWDNFNPTAVKEATKKSSRKESYLNPNRSKGARAGASSSLEAGRYDRSIVGQIGFQEWFIEIAKEMLRVTKPGGTMLTFGGTRTYHRMACAIEDSGWILKDCIMWLFGSGFPKATDISKQLDRGHTTNRKIEIDFVRFLQEHKKGKSNSDIDKCLRLINGAFHFFAESDSNRIIPNEKQYKKLKKLLELPNDFDSYVKEKNKELMDIRKIQGYEKSIKNWDKQYNKPILNEPATPEAKLWNGWKSHGLKPAYEPILVAMKPNEGSYARNALKHGVAGLNIDGARIGIEGEDDRHAGRRTKTFAKKEEAISGGEGSPEYIPSEQGRFPSNIILDEEAAKILDKQSGERVSGGSEKPRKPSDGRWFGKDGFDAKDIIYKDKGGASRFFYVAKASREERNMGCEGIPKKAMTDLDKIGGKKSNFKTGQGKERDIYLNNNHPTVKPLKLMEYLCLLTKTPTGGIVLDPFSGSGTTGIACKKTKRDFIGIEKEPEYCKIAEARIKAQPTPLF